MGSRYNPRLSIIDNIQLPPTLLSRFDLIYLVLDKADEASDRKLARHLIAMYHATAPANVQVLATDVVSGPPVIFARADDIGPTIYAALFPIAVHQDICRATAARHLAGQEHTSWCIVGWDAGLATCPWSAHGPTARNHRLLFTMTAHTPCCRSTQATIPVDTLRDYIAYARSQSKPKLSEEAASTLIDGYVDMRRQGVSRKASAILHVTMLARPTYPNAGWIIG